MGRTRFQRLGHAVRQLRLQAGLTQDQLGTPHVSKSFISQLEQGNVSPSLATLFHIGDRLGAPAAQLLAAADDGQQAAALLDMAEAALQLEGIGGGNEWIAHLETVLPVAQLAPHGLDHRWSRYSGLVRLAQGKADSAITMLEAARPQDEPIAMYWLGLAHRRAGHLLQALRAWEFILDSPGLLHGEAADRAEDGRDPLHPNVLDVVTRWQLVGLYESLGDSTEAERAAAMLTEAAAPDLASSAPFARLLWAEARREWDANDVVGAAGLARRAALLGSIEGKVPASASSRSR